MSLQLLSKKNVCYAIKQMLIYSVKTPCKHSIKVSLNRSTNLSPDNTDQQTLVAVLSTVIFISINVKKRFDRDVTQTKCLVKRLPMVWQ